MNLVICLIYFMYVVIFMIFSYLYNTILLVACWDSNESTH
jgi:hypothetical protein